MKIWCKLRKQSKQIQNKRLEKKLSQKIRSTTNPSWKTVGKELISKIKIIS